jgi:MoxR-like ATPase
MRGQPFVSVEDIRAYALPALRHRLLLNFEGEAEQINADAIVSEMLTAVATE